MYHFQGGAANSAPPYQQPQPAHYPGYSPTTQVRSAQLPGYAPQQPAQHGQYSSYSSSHQPQPPGTHQPTQQPYYQQPGYVTNQAQQAGTFPQTATPQAWNQYQQPAYVPNQAYASGAPSQVATNQSSSHSCYNCGRSDHWAQNCPEPRRSQPAGAMNGSRPLKRQRTTGPIITKYPPPPYQQAPASLQRGFTHPPVGHHAFPPSHGPPTPASAQSQSYNGWNSQQTPWPTQTAQQVKQHWIPPAIPNPVSSHGSQHGSPISINGNSQSRNFQYSQPAPSPSQASPIRKTSYGSVEPSPVRAPGSFDSSMYPQSRTRDQAAFLNEIKASDANGEEVEPWLEELQVLDFVDGKPASGPVVSHPANPVAQPLPSNAAEADAIGRLPIAASLPAGVSISRYLRDLDPETFERNVKQKDEWIEVSDDPVFAEIRSDGDAISVSELVERRKEALATDDDDEAEDSEYRTGSQGYESDYDDDRRANNREPSQSTACKHEGTLCPQAQAEEAQFSREQEERLAALGVSGIPKPVQPSMRRTVAVTDPPTSTPQSPYQPSRSSSIDKKTTEVDNLDSPSSGGMNGHSPDHSRKLSYTKGSSHPNGSAKHYSLDPKPSLDNSHQERANRDPLSRYSSYERSQPLPPPPPLRYRQRYFDGSSSIHDSPTDLQGPNLESEFSTNRHSKSPTNEDMYANPSNDTMSPLRSKSDPQLSRKRSYRHSSEESDGGPKRQEEEIAQRNKRKQPKIAAAYSRRW